MIFFMAYLFGGVVLLFAVGNRAQHRRTAAIPDQWQRASGRILEFGVTHGRPQVRYEYEVDGQRYESERLIPGIRGSGTSGSAPLRKTWIDPRGQLLYPSGAKAVVYHHPDDPTDATLYPGAGYRPFASIPLGLLMIGGTLAAQFAGPEALRRDPPILIAGVLMLGAFLLLLLSFRNLWRSLRGRDFSSVEGRIIKAESKPMGKRSYQLAAKYAYTANGVRYVSGTLEASGVVTGESREKVQAKADALLAEPRVRIWYDSQKPWVCFLRNSPLSAAGIPFLASLFLLLLVFLMLSDGR